MKKLLFSLLALMVLTVGLVSASPNLCHRGVGNIDKECQDHGFDYGIAKFEYKNGGYSLDEGITSPYSVQILDNSTGSAVFWTANPSVDGVLLKTTKDYYVTGEGGVSGAAYMDIKNDISHATFCGNYESEEVPEFGAVAAVGVLAIAGLFIFKRREF